MHLYVLDGGGEIRQVDPEYRVALRIVDGNTVSGDVDACAICSADSQRGVTHPGTGIAGSNGGGCHTQQIRQVLSEILFFQLFFAYIGECHRCAVCGTCGDDFHFLQVYHPQAVLFLCLRTDTQCCRQEADRHCMSLHLQLFRLDEYRKGELFFFSLRRHYPDQVNGYDLSPSY